MNAAISEEIISDIMYLTDVYYLDVYHTDKVDALIHKVNILAGNVDDQHWNVAAHLPTPGIKLHCRLADGRIVDGVRPSYISDRKNDDLGYRSLDGEVLNVKEWSIQ